MTPEWAFILRIALISLVILGLERLAKLRARQAARRSAGQVVDLSAFRAPPVRLEKSSISAVQTGSAQPTTTIVRLEPLSRRADYVTEKRAA